MNLELFRSYRSATCPKRAQSLLSQIIAGEQRLLLKCAQRVARRAADVPDLMQNGTIGLMSALRRFDPKRGPWGVYARQWCLYEMRRGGQDLIGPRHWRHTMPKSVREQKRIFEERVGRTATCDDLGIPKKKWDRWNSSFVRIDSEYLTPLNDSAAFHGTISIYDKQLIEKTAVEQEPPVLSDAMIRCLGVLNVDEHRVLLKSILDGSYYAEIAEEEGTNPARVRDLIGVARRKLRDAFVKSKMSTTT